ncbi:unnamed protein product [Symbiodinium sp. CCMP2592]|nr:unnamed protein product [Symbiodinium sp. CCMP2592]
MSVHLTVALASGRHADIDVSPGATIEDLRRQAQEELGGSIRHLLGPRGDALPRSSSVGEVGLADGAVLTAVVAECQVAASMLAFACLRGDGSVTTLGPEKYGGDCGLAQESLQTVVKIQSTLRQFAAIREDGTVVHWGRDVAPLPGEFKAKEIQSTSLAFAAICPDGSLVSWGDPSSGGDSQEVQAQLRNVQQLQANTDSFAAVCADGGVVCWGGFLDPDDDELKGVEKIQATSAAFAALRRDGSVVTWGPAQNGGNCSKVRDRLKNVQHIQANPGNLFRSFCRNPLRWQRGDLGMARLRRGQHGSRRSLKASEGNPV